ncbi:hypothetical protein SLS59_008660 [Nothophoma quercina]|uniref:Heterokaryon incompatibility domain-containing protein n=1 Tax=Nothophoma quercina TaxID=749835 RepID=A0ABR3QRS5_9PLEO
MDYTTTPVPYLPRLGHLEFLELDEEELDTSSLQAKLILSPTRNYLLSRRRIWDTAARDEIDADTLLVDLGHLAPTVAKDFISKEYTEASFAFRLINDVEYNGEEESYIAMSYCWKKMNRDTPKKVIEDLPFAWTREVEQFPLPTSSALFQAVLREKSPAEGLWFDQVCINQEDDAERATTIGAIDTIYKNARVVVVALDDIIVTPEEEQFLRCYLNTYSCSDLSIDQQPNARQTPPFMYQYPVFVSFFERFIESEWFERAWCAHEMRLGQQLVFLLRCSSQYEDEVQTVLRFTTSFLFHMLVLASELVTFTPAQQTRIRTLQDFLIGHEGTKASNGLAVRRPDTPQTPSFKPTAFVPTIVDTFQLKAGGNPRLPEYMKRLDANRDKTCIALGAAKLPITLAPSNPYQRPNIEDECLRSLLLVGIAARDPFRIPGPGMWNFWQTPDHPRAASMRNVFIQTLGCIFDCGPQWLLELSTSHNFSHISTLEPHTIDMLLNPHLIIQNYILLPEGQSALSSLLTCISTILIAGIPWASGATERTHGPLIVSAPTPSYLAIDPTYGGKAVIFAPFAHSKTLLVAVPDAVKAAEYDGLARAWILTSMSPFTGSPKQSVSWTLQSKGVVFGDGNFNAGLARSVETRCHRVYGPSIQVVQ